MNLTQFTDDTGFTEMYIMKECARSYPIVIALQKHSVYRSKFSYLIRQMQVIDFKILFVIRWLCHKFLGSWSD